LNVKHKGSYFDTIEVIEAESQVVLNTVTEHNIQDPFKNSKSTENGTYTQKGTTSRVMVASRLKVFDKMAAQVLKTMNGSFYYRNARPFMWFDYDCILSVSVGKTWVKSECFPSKLH
jgi:hypothetical protein